MNPQRPTPEEINRYLLGSLSDAQIERFDELSVIDTEFAEALAAAEKDLIDSYAQGELTGDVLEQFKSHYLSSPVRRTRVNFAQAFQVFAEKHQNEGITENSLKPAIPARVSRHFPARNVFQFPRLMTWGLAAAAVVILAAILYYSGGRQPAAPRIASFVLSPQTRDAGPIPRISLPAQTDDVRIDLELEPNDYATFRVELIDETDNQILWHHEQLTARMASNVRIARIQFPADLLKSRTYILRVTGISADGLPEVVGDYPFKTVK